jgi:hypothetical protein
MRTVSSLRIPHVFVTKKVTLACVRCKTTVARPVLVVDGLRVYVSRTRVELAPEFTLGPNGWRYSPRARRRQAKGRSGTLRRAESWVRELEERAAQITRAATLLREAEARGDTATAAQLRALLASERPDIDAESLSRAFGWRVTETPFDVYCQCKHRLHITCDDVAGLLERLVAVAADHGAT